VHTFRFPNMQTLFPASGQPLIASLVGEETCVPTVILIFV
jgi:hypothetical protein